MKLAIGLVRGYEDVDDYKTLILRNKSIHKTINSKLDEPFDMIIFMKEIFQKIIKIISKKIPKILIL